MFNQPEENHMSDRDSNLGSDESRNPDLGRDEDSGMSGSRSDRDRDESSSGDSGTSRDRSSNGGSGSDRDLGNDEIGSDNVSSR